MAGLEPAAAAVLQASAALPEGSTIVCGPSTLADAGSACASLGNIGYQATQFARAADVMTAALEKKSSGLLFFLGVSSNLAATGVRDAVTFLIRHRMVDAVVLSGGAAEMDLARALGVVPTLVSGNETASSTTTKSNNSSTEKGKRQICNILVDEVASKECLSSFVLKLLPSLFSAQAKEKAKCLAEAKRDNDVCYTDWTTTPSKFWAAVGEALPQLAPESNFESSFLYWAAKNGIPLFSPNFSDGTMGEVLVDLPEAQSLVFDLVGDIGVLNRTAMKAASTAMLIAGGGVVKHHVCNANLMRNGADYAVFLNNAQEYDGSDAGARPDEAVSWGKIKIDGSSAKVYGEISITFPLLVQQAFLPYLARHPDHFQKKVEEE